jgi:hypothetical protein
VDSACLTPLLVTDRSLLQDFHPAELSFKAINGSTMVTEGVGTAQLHFNSVDEGQPPLVFKVKAYWGPEVEFPLLGTQSLHKDLARAQASTAAPATVIIDHGGGVLQIKFNDKWYSTALRATDAGPASSTLFQGQESPAPLSVASISSTSRERVTLQQLHERLGHASVRRCMATAEAMDDVILVRKPGDLELDCQSCIQAKFTRPPHTGVIQPTEGLVATDTMHMSPQSTGQHKFMQVFVHSWTRYLWVVPMKNKTRQELFRAFTMVRSDMLRAGHEFTILQSDGAKELTGKHTPTAVFCKANAIKLDTAIADDHFGNTLAERGIQRFQVGMRVNWLESGLPNTLWHRFAAHVVTSINHTFHTTKRAIPSQLFWTQSSAIGALHPLGCRVFYFNPPEQRVRSAKLTMPSRPGWYLGPADRHKEYYVLQDGSTRKTVIARAPRFVHSVRYGQSNTPSVRTPATTAVNQPPRVHFADQANPTSSVGEHTSDAPAALSAVKSPDDHSRSPPPAARPAREHRSRSVTMDTANPAFQEEFQRRLDVLVAKEERKRAGSRQGWTHTDLFDHDELVAKALASTKSWWRRSRRHVSTTRPTSPETELSQPALIVHEGVVEDSNIVLAKGMAGLEHLTPGPLPTSLKKLRNHPAASLILDAMARELGQVLEATLQAVSRASLPDDAEVIPSMFLNTCKRDKTVKSRLVALGNLQKQDRAGYYSATADSVTFKVVIAHAVHRDWAIKQRDVVGAFLKARPFSDKVFITLPPGWQTIWELLGKRLPEHAQSLVFKLTRSLYGLRSSPASWFTTFVTFLKQLGFIQSIWDASMLYLTRGHLVIYLVLHVDDFIATCASEAFLDEVLALIHAKFELKDLGDLGMSSDLLGVQIQYDRSQGVAVLHQTAYIDSMIARFNLGDRPSVSSPFRSSSSSVASKPAEIKVYQSLVGGLLYLCRMTAPHLLFACKELTRSFANPSTADMAAAEHLLVYARSTATTHRLVFRRSTMVALDSSRSPWYGYSDSSHADQPDMRSSAGFVIFYLGSAVCVVSKTLPLVRLSTHGSEQAGLVRLLIKLVWLQGIGRELRLPNNHLPAMVFLDNKGVVDNIGSDKVSPSMRHNAIKLHFIRDARDLQVFQPQWVPTTDMIADVLTKALTRELFEGFARSLLDGADALVRALRGSAEPLQ